MNLDKCCDKNNINCVFVGVPGPKGDKGDSSASFVDAIFATGFNDTKVNGKMSFYNPWFLPSDSEYFVNINDTDIGILSGVYEIVLSGLIFDADETHGAEVYLADENGSAIKDLNFVLKEGYGKQLYFTKSIVFRFEKDTTLSLLVNFLGDDFLNVVVKDVNMVIKRIHE